MIELRATPQERKIELNFQTKSPKQRPNKQQKQNTKQTTKAKHQTKVNHKSSQNTINHPIKQGLN